MNDSFRQSKIHSIRNFLVTLGIASVSIPLLGCANGDVFQSARVSQWETPTTQQDTATQQDTRNPARHRKPARRCNPARRSRQPGCIRFGPIRRSSNYATACEEKFCGDFPGFCKKLFEPQLSNHHNASIQQRFGTADCRSSRPRAARFLCGLVWTLPATRRNFARLGRRSRADSNDHHQDQFRQAS